jgi:DNA-binding transcriptional ArsR family regulator
MAHPGRLALLKLLIQAGPDGLPAGAIARAAGLAPPTATGQLARLVAAGLLAQARKGRQVIYSASYRSMTELLGYLMADCCCGRTEICAPLTAQGGASAP